MHTLIAAALAAASPSISAQASQLGITDTQIANCAQTTLDANHLTARAARRLQIGRAITVQGARDVLASGDTVWGTCRLSLQVVAREAFGRELQRYETDIANLEKEYERLPKRIKRANTAARLNILLMKVWLGQMSSVRP